jgi:hypothetical protein
VPAGRSCRVGRSGSRAILSFMTETPEEPSAKFAMRGQDHIPCQVVSDRWVDLPWAPRIGDGLDKGQEDRG